MALMVFENPDTYRALNNQEREIVKSQLEVIITIVLNKIDEPKKEPGKILNLIPRRSR